jgi:hypothetical protein
MRHQLPPVDGTETPFLLGIPLDNSYPNDRPLGAKTENFLCNAL